jgi:molybdopterin-guanine dinucleotide biosynthesis protein A
MNDPTFDAVHDDELAQARLVCEDAYQAVVAYIPTDAMERCEALLKRDAKVGRLAFHGLEHLYVPMPDIVKLANAIMKYRLIEHGQAA